MQKKIIEKKYFVSLALKVSSNFEVEVKANSKNEALEKALEKYHGGSFDEEAIQDPDWSNAELDIDEESKINKLDNGVYIRELEK